MSKETWIFSLAVCALISVLWIPDAWAFADPIVTKVNDAADQIVRIGKGVIGVSLVFAVIIMALGHPQWKWFLYLLIAGICLTASGPLISWING